MIIGVERGSTSPKHTLLSALRTNWIIYSGRHSSRPDSFRERAYRA
jgi:hypothetical protein